MKYAAIYFVISGLLMGLWGFGMICITAHYLAPVNQIIYYPDGYDSSISKKERELCWQRVQQFDEKYSVTLFSPTSHVGDGGLLLGTFGILHFGLAFCLWVSSIHSRI